MAGTNPDQGAALARATAETLAERPGLAIITTHYDSLKALGESDARFANAAMEYDLEALRPTFRLATGAPGRSYAFDIAARMGLPDALLERARDAGGLVQRRPRVGDRAAAGARGGRWSSSRERLAEAEAAAAATAEAQREAAAALARRERELGLKAREAVEAAVAETRAALAQIVRDAQQAGSARAAEAGRAEVERVAAEALARLPAAREAAPRATIALAAGARVFVAAPERRRRRARAARRARARQGQRRRDDRRGDGRRARPAEDDRARGGAQRSGGKPAAARRRARPRRRRATTSR